jgi:hypothetical protein
MRAAAKAWPCGKTATVTFDALIRTNADGVGCDDPGAIVPNLVVAPLLAIETGSGTLVCITTDLPAIDGEWKHYSITLQENPADTPLTDGNGWLVITNTLAALPLLLSAPFGLGFARRGRTSG